VQLCVEANKITNTILLKNLAASDSKILYQKVGVWLEFELWECSTQSRNNVEFTSLLNQRLWLWTLDSVPVWANGKYAVFKCSYVAINSFNDDAQSFFFLFL